ncbi:type I toxin-antitoxin system ptaRNA1 family toxin [Methylomonas sp. LL1]|uniref:type I toxin-antitoxin system ptaRNA1 family toxin n=1 Tax=Methylomonas sp. LL1 TaxID=2785785 RepID=UPI0018C397B7|nr:type I toxin-antitoxin system ptaRNA1 family toxin [Methylomonas sp. LL1]QPK63841.1 type I toxin-antitoxin system ptaRNA1 family toxin [Methylomonas sp. LL1]
MAAALIFIIAFYQHEVSPALPEDFSLFIKATRQAYAEPQKPLGADNISYQPIILQETLKPAISR